MSRTIPFSTEIMGSDKFHFLSFHPKIALGFIFMVKQSKNSAYSVILVFSVKKKKRAIQ